MNVVSNKKDEICLIKLFRESVNMKKVLLFLFLVLCIFTSCKSSNVKSVVAAESKFDLDFFADNEISFLIVIKDICLYFLYAWSKILLIKLN